MGYFRRFRGSGRDDEAGREADSVESSLERYLQYSVRGDDVSVRDESDALHVQYDDAPEAAASVGGGQPAAAAGRSADPAVYDQLGQHVSTVLSSADEAARRLQEAASKDAERIRAEVETYAQDTRASADAYAEERREAAEQEASAMVSEAEMRARDVREAAEQEAAEIQREAIRRRESLFEESERAQERLRNLLEVFRTMTDRLEELVGSRDAAVAERKGAEEDLTETLIAHSRSSTATEESGAAEA